MESDDKIKIKTLQKSLILSFRIFQSWGYLPLGWNLLYMYYDSKDQMVFEKLMVSIHSLSTNLIRRIKN